MALGPTGGVRRPIECEEPVETRAAWLIRQHPIADSSYARGVAGVLGAAGSFGLLGTLSGLAYGAGMGAATFTTLRAAIGAVALAVLVFSGRRARVALRGLPRRQLAALSLAVAANAALSLALFAAYGTMSVALVLSIYFTYPILVAIASVALGRERFTSARLCGLILALAGLAGVVGSQIGPGAHVALAGIFFAALTAVCQATYLVVSRSGYPSVPAEQATAIILTAGAILAGAVALAVDGPVGRLTVWMGSPSAWGAALVAGTLGAAIAKVWLLRGVRLIGGTRTAVLMLAEPVVGVVAAAVVLGQAMTPIQLAAGALIIAGAALVQKPAAALVQPRVAGGAPAIGATTTP